MKYAAVWLAITHSQVSLFFCPPRCFVDVVHSCALRYVANCFVMRFDGCGYAIKYFLDTTLADGQIEDGEKKILNSTAAVAVRPAKLSYQRRYSWAEPRAVLGRYERLVELAAAAATPAVQSDVFDDQLSRRQFDKLMDVIRLKIVKFGSAAFALSRKQLNNFSWPKTLLPMPFTLATAF